LEYSTAFERDFYESSFRIMDAGYINGRVEMTVKSRKVYWQNWTVYVTLLRVNPFLQGEGGSYII